jgi:hypothetical protein
MSPTEIIILLALTGYAIYQQTRRHQVVGESRFKLAIIYAVVGLIVGGMHLPTTVLTVTFLLISFGLSVVVGLLRGRLTKVWAAADGHVYSQGTVLTISLFIGLVAVKFVLGTIAYFLHISDDGGFGEILLMIAIMVAFQAELIWRRAQAISPVNGPQDDRDASTAASADDRSLVRH